MKGDEAPVAEDDPSVLGPPGFVVAGSPAIEVAHAASECPDLIRAFRRFDPINLAATFGGLLTQPALQTSCLRLELLVHLSLAFASGPRAATSDLVRKGFASVGSVYGQYEDAAEDVFVANISSPHGNYLVLEGIWECGTFYLQRFVNLAATLPDVAPLNSVERSIHALLAVSHLVCLRAGLRRNSLGGTTGFAALPGDLIRVTRTLRALVQVTFTELAAVGVDVADLRPFAFDVDRRSGLATQRILHSDLERRPLVIERDRVTLVLPTAVSPAIRRYFIDRVGFGQNRPVLQQQLAFEYSRELQRSPMLGLARGEGLLFFPSAWGSMCCASMQADKGRHLILVVLLDGLNDFSPDGLTGLFRSNSAMDQEVEQAVKTMQDACVASAGFRDGVVLFVLCGVGRGVALAPLSAREGWWVDYISAPDFCTLGWSKGMQTLRLWRIFQMRDDLRRMGAHLQNVNGVLNLVAWANSLDGHLVPHADLPDEASERPFIFMVRQNALLDLRHDVVIANDVHVEPFVDGTWLSVQTEGRGYFEEDSRQPVYGSLDTVPGAAPLGLCITPTRAWWFETTSLSGDSSTSSHDRWRMLGTWCARSAMHLERVFGTHLGAGPVLWQCVFLAPQQEVDPNDPLGTVADAEGSIQVAVDPGRRTIRLVIDPGFDRAVFNPENIAEAALASAFVDGVVRLAGNPPFDREDLLRKIVPNARARYSHVFVAREFRDFMAILLRKEPVTISKDDDAAVKLNLGWKVRDKKSGSEVDGKSECTLFLNALVRHLEDELCADLRSFNRKGLIIALLLNHEMASASRDYWHKTASALMALRDDGPATLAAMRKHEMSLNAVLQSSRNLIEMAICESTLEGGIDPGELDLSLLMAKASQIHHLGGMSDLAHWGFLYPHLVIRPLGDVHARHDFVDTVVEGFGAASSDYRFKGSVRRYDRNLKMPEVSVDSTGLDQRFLEAWSQEFGFELDAMRRFVDATEDLCLGLGQPVTVLGRASLEALADPGVGAKIVDAFGLHPRRSWRELPDGYDQKDTALWKFRRRLSALRRPLFHLSAPPDSEIVLAPGLLREAFVSTLGNYFHGSYHDRHLGPPMLQYAGYARDRNGREFNAKVAEALSAMGWRTQSEVRMTKIIGKSLGRDYGDVDVLATSPAGDRVLVVECKDLQFRKTHGEIAEQLMDFAGVVKDDGKRDLLRKHLDRVQQLRDHRAAVCHFVSAVPDAGIESHLVFSNPVPMQHVTGALTEECTLHTFDSLESLRVRPES
jgi:hypothetical protein